MSKFFAGLLSEMSYDGVDATKELVDLIQTGREKDARLVFMALKNAGSAATFLTPTLLEIVIGAEEWRAELAEDTIVRIGLSAIPHIVAFEHIHPQHPAVQSLRIRIEQNSVHREVEDLSWINDTVRIRLFTFIADVLEAHGPTGFLRMAAILKEQSSANHAIKSLKISSTTLRTCVEFLEKSMSDKWMRPIRLIDRKNNRAGTLTDDGKKFAGMAKRYLASLRIGGD